MKRITSFVYWGRKVIEIIIYFVIPALILFEIIDMHTSLVLSWLGITLSIIGLCLMIWTRFNRDKDWGFMGDESSDILFTSGPYVFSRHPYYAGAILVALGIYLQLNYYLVILLIPAIVFIIHVIRKEDAFLEEKFGSQFTDYKKRVGVIPWFY
jgi:protein-S-isoprenylcysteine O-methyltransferase Ste14